MALLKPSPSRNTQTCCGWSWSTAAAQSPLVVLAPASFPSSLSRRPLPSLLVQLGRPRRGRGRRIAIGCVASRRSSEAPSSGSSSRGSSSAAAAMAAAARVKAVATIKATVGGFLDSLRPSRAIDDVKDLIGRSLYLELVSSQLDANHGVNEGEPVDEQCCEQVDEDPFRDPEPEGQDFPEGFEDEEDPDFVPDDAE